MQASLAAEYFKAVEQIEAQEALLAMAIADHPHNKTEIRKSFHKKIYGIGYPETKEKRPIHSMEELARLMMGGNRG